MLASDTVLQGRYRIIRQLGQGGMGTVYEALALRLDTPVAIKETHFTEERLRKQFEREAQLLARMRHPSLPRVIDHFDEGDGLFLVMDYIPGEDLWETLNRQGSAFPVDKVLDWGDQLLDALEYLHAQEPPVVHRDIKPQNLKLTSKNQIVLLDFGLAKGFAGQISRVTTSGSIFGYTPNYAPLEQIQGTGTSARSDLYSLAATLYHLMTDKTPPDVLTRLTATTNGQPDPLLSAHEVNYQVPPAVAEVLQQGMSIGSNQRFASALEMRQALRQASQPPALADSDPAKTQLFIPPTIVSPGMAEPAPEVVTPPALASTAYSPSGQISAPTIASFFEQPPASQLDSRAHGISQSAALPSTAATSRRRVGLLLALLVLGLLLAGGVSVLIFRDRLWKEGTQQAQGNPSASSQNNAQTQVAAHIKQGDDYYEKYDYDKAIAEYTEAIKLDQKNAEAYRKRGRAYRGIYKYNESLADYNQAIQLNPTDAKAYGGRGNTYRLLYKYDQAITDYNKAIELDPQDALSYDGLGRTYEAMSKYDQAITNFSKAIQLDPKSSDNYADRGFVYYLKGRNSLAIADFNKALEIDPKNPLVYINRGGYYADTGKYDLAIADLNEAIQLGSKSPAIYNNRGVAYKNKGDYDQAIQDYTEAIRLKPDYALAYKNRGEAYRKTGQRDLAKADEEKASQLEAKTKRP